MDLGNSELVDAGLRASFACLAAAGVKSATFLSGLAVGADQMAAAVWHEQALGPIHVVHPFLHDQPRPRDGVIVHSTTWLDGRALQALGRNPHLAQTQWIIAAADLLVVVWTGRPGRGAGGTADAVRLALERKAPVLWVKPGDACPRLIRPEYLDHDFGFLELIEQLDRAEAPLVVPATAEALAALLPPVQGEPSAPATGARWMDRILGRTVWRAYDAFVRLVGGASEPSSVDPAPPPDLLDYAGFQCLTHAYSAADADAQRLAATHRSQQLLVLAAAIGAAAIGSAPAVWPELKIHAVLAELALAILALIISLGAGRAQRHERWSRARRLAEQLRLERAAWVLGLSTGDAQGCSPAGAVHQARRQAGVADGAYDADRVERWGDWALSELVGSQARYHRRHASLNHRIAHRIHRFETASFAVFLLALAGFASAYFITRSLGVALPHWVAGAVVMTSIIVPALGAASIAIEATLAFGELSLRNGEMAAKLDALSAGLGPARGLDALQRTAKLAISLQMNHEERWIEESFRRRLVRAG